MLSVGAAAGVFSGAVILCVIAALSHQLLARRLEAKAGTLWPIAWLLVALGGGGHLVSQILPMAGVDGAGGALVFAGLIGMGLALDWKGAASAETRSPLWWVMGVVAVLIVLAAVLPLATWRMILGAAILLALAWLVWRVWAVIEPLILRLLFTVALLTLAPWGAAALFAPLTSASGPWQILLAVLLLIGLCELAFASILGVADVEIEGLQTEVSELKETHDHLLRLAESDPLTGCPNRQALRAWFDRWEGGEPVSVVLIDIDNLKRINDHHGSDAGDEALRLVSGVLKESIRQGDIVVRWGGDEFVLVLRGAGHDAAKRRTTSLIATVEEATKGFRYEQPLRVDWGVSSCSAPSDISRALAEADERMYAMKRRR
jgi:diguanylate cyclase (GGDEF)-like protein